MYVCQIPVKLDRNAFRFASATEVGFRPVEKAEHGMLWPDSAVIRLEQESCPGFRHHKNWNENRNVQPRFRPTANSPNTKRPPTVDCGMVVFLDRDRRSNLVLPSRFGHGINPPLAGRISPRICTPINGAVAPLPVRIGPHLSTTTLIMVLRWGSRGGFALLNP